MMLTPPNLLWLTDGHAEGETKLNAFDNALIAAGIGHWNLVKVTSVAPQAAAVTAEPVEIEAGAVVPAVLASAISDRPGDQVTACIGVGLSTTSHGMIMEHSGVGTPEDMEPVVRRMVQESFMRRGLELETLIVRSVCHTVTGVGASVAAVVLWWG
jgi:arginine decarboxylase